jgi:hypothetical protein
MANNNENDDEVVNNNENDDEVVNNNLAPVIPIGLLEAIGVVPHANLIEAMRMQGIPDQAIRAALQQAGVPNDNINAAWAELDFGVAQANNGDLLNNNGLAPGVPPVVGPPPNNNGNNNDDDDDDDDEWPNNLPPGPPAPPAAPKPPKPSKFATALTAAEKTALLTPRAAQPQSFGVDITNHVEDALYEVLKIGFDKVHPEKSKEECIEILRALLKQHNAIISGGFILKLILNVSDADWAIQSNLRSNHIYKYKTKLNTQINSGVDVDFYVPCKDLIPFYTILLPLFQANKWKSYQASFYCRSFLRKNGIRKVYKFTRPEVPGQLTEMDIMAVRNSRSPLDVVTNFDLTVCQVWYDGTSVKATDPEHVLNKVTYLQGDYVKTYLRGNRFLNWRLKKYTKRGFKVLGDPAILSTLSPMDIIPNPTFGATGCGFEDEPRIHIRDDPKRWLIRALLYFKKTGKYHIRSTVKDTAQVSDIGYSTPAQVKLRYNLDLLDGYDTDDFIENPQLLRDMLQSEDPVVSFTNKFFALFNEIGDTNPFADIVDVQEQSNLDYVKRTRVYKEIMALKPKVLELVPPPAHAGGRRMTRRRR